VREGGRFSTDTFGKSAENRHRFWKPGDEWSDPSTGTHIDIMYVRLSGLRGKSTQFYRVTKLRSGIPPVLYNVVHSKHYLTREVGIRTAESFRVRIPKLRSAVLRKNWPVPAKPFIVIDTKSKSL